MTLNSICNRLTARQLMVLSHIVAGDKQKEIARNLGISPRTVEVHHIHIREKLGARNTADVIRIALRGA